MLRQLATSIVTAYKAKGIDPASIKEPEVEGQTPFCNGTTGCLYVSFDFNPDEHS